MLIPTDEFGYVPYDSFRLHSREPPRLDFLADVSTIAEGARWRASEHSSRRIWTNFVSLKVNGAAGALAVGWQPTMIGLNTPQIMVRCNPSTANLGPNETYALMRWVLECPDASRIAVLATKQDLQGAPEHVDACLYLPGVRKKGRSVGTTHYHGSQKGNELDSYDKSAQLGGQPGTIARVEYTERFKGGKRLQLIPFLSGAYVDQNGLKRVKVFDVCALQDPTLLERAAAFGLTEAMRNGHLPKKWGAGPGGNMAALRRKINAGATLEVYEHYRVRAQQWHSQFSLATAETLQVTWHNELGLVVALGPLQT